MLSDRIHPMVIKELRQGLKSRGFAVSLQGLQLLLLLSMLIYAMNLPHPSNPGGGDPESANTFYWGFIALVLLGVFPVRASVAVSSERSEDNLDLLQLTHMRSTGILTGKWLSLALQTLLIVSTLLPYLVARYFFGNLNLAFDLQLLLMITVVSLALSAGAAGLSAIPGKWSRHLIQWPLAGILGLLGSVLLEELGPSTWFDTATITLILFFSLAFLFFSLHFGGTQIGTGQVNHALPKRLTALSLPVVLSLTAMIHRMDTDYIMLLAYLFSGIMMVDALSEPLPEEYAVRPRRRIPLLNPGIHSAIGFAALLAVVFAICESYLDSDAHPWLTPWNYFNLLLFPVAIQSFFRTRPSLRLLQNVCLHFAAFGLAVFSLALPRGFKAHQLERPASAMLPVLNFFHLIDDGYSHTTDDIVLTGTMTVVLLLCIFLNHWRKTHARPRDF
ncbi:MAG: hypothetical protein JJU05_07710 [Verrucomicrobia bacterium]|nr:hypothetical protein [Verrucomicrobiota bacterium]MCH8528751.1 hypothetical protein [Kiritimatiellia bacterium]